MSGNWDDLKPRAISAVVMAVVGAGAVWAGGIWFTAVIAICSGIMVWELVRMIAPDFGSEALQAGVIATIVLLSTLFLPDALTAIFLVLPAVVLLNALKTKRLIYFSYTLLILVAGYVFIALRQQDLGLVWLAWVLLIVITSDLAGYLAGRLLGGPKFWPRVSPKKTWSGTIAGWIGAAIVGFIMFSSVQLALASMLVAFAAQMGDIAESAIKRKCGVKDSSNLIPGHGGFLDRFDGMLGAAALVFVLMLLTDFMAIG